jgi:hypothetical protein
VHGATMLVALAVTVRCAHRVRVGSDTQPVPATSGASR